MITWRTALANQLVCISCREPALRQKLEDQLRSQYRLSFSDSPQELADLLKKQDIACIVANPMQAGICHLWEFREIMSNFEIVPLIIACGCINFDFLKTCAASFADDCIEVNGLDVAERVETTITRRDFQNQHLAHDIHANQYPPRMKQALKIIHSGFTRLKFAEEVSSQLGISVTTFRKQFVQIFGTPFTQYLIKTKLLYAVHLAQNRGLTGKAIASRCGFNSAREFYRCFKRKMSLQFSAYRAKYTERDFEQLYTDQSNHIFPHNF